MEKFSRGPLATLLRRPRLIIMSDSKERPPYGGVPFLKRTQFAVGVAVRAFGQRASDQGPQTCAQASRERQRS